MAAPQANRVLTACDRLYRLLLVAYPPAFRREYAAPMAQVFRDSCREAERRCGLPGLARLWLATLRDLAVSAVVERFSELARLFRAQWVRWSGLASILAGVLWIVWMPVEDGRLPGLTHAGGHVLLAVSCLCLLAALTGIYARYVGRAGQVGKPGVILGLVGAAVAVLGNTIEGAFALEGGWALFGLGQLLLLLGLALFSGAALRANLLPGWCTWPFILGALGFALTIGLAIIIRPPERSWFTALPATVMLVFSFGWMALGYVLWSHAGEYTSGPPLAIG